MLFRLRCEVEERKYFPDKPWVEQIVWRKRAKFNADDMDDALVKVMPIVEGYSEIQEYRKDVHLKFSEPTWSDWQKTQGGFYGRGLTLKVQYEWDEHSRTIHLFVDYYRKGVD